MSDLAAIQLTAAGALLASLAIWIGVARLLRRRGIGRWRALPLGLTLAGAAALYGLYWTAFFASPALAVKTHAVRLVLTHVLGDKAPWIAAGWMALAALPLLPLVRR